MDAGRAVVQLAAVALRQRRVWHLIERAPSSHSVALHPASPEPGARSVAMCPAHVDKRHSPVRDDKAADDVDNIDLLYW